MSEQGVDNRYQNLEAGARNVVLADVAGFCFGVRRAVDLAARARSERSGCVTTLGPLVHNSLVTQRLQESGIAAADDLDSVATGTVVLSAHGSAPIVLREARARKLDVVDATCPFVTKLHRAAKSLVAEGYEVVVVGDPGHTEMVGLLAAVREAGGSAHLVADAEQARALPLGKKVGVVSQTTQRAASFAAVVADVCARTPDVRAVNTVCSATDELQSAARDLARRTDVILVVGGKNSANTRRLCELCVEAGTPAYHIGTPDEIDPKWLDGKVNVGITAGASTPDWLIDDVARAVNGGSLPAGWVVRHPDA